jgi:hypothetical protein
MKCSPPRMVARAFSQPSRASCAERSRSWLFQLKPSPSPSMPLLRSAPRGGWPALGAARRRRSARTCGARRSARRHLHELEDLHRLAAAVGAQRQAEGGRALALAVAGVDDDQTAALALGLFRRAWLAGWGFDLHVSGPSGRCSAAAPPTARPAAWHGDAVVEHLLPARGGWRGRRRRPGGPRGPAPSPPGRRRAAPCVISCSTLTTVLPCATRLRTSASQSAWCGGSRLASGSSISSTSPAPPARAPAARAGARRPRAAQRRHAPVPGLGGAQARSTAAWSAGLGGASQAWCGRRPSMATSYTVRSSALAFVLPQPGQRAGALARLGQRASGGPSSAPRRRCGSSPASALQQGRLARAVGADDAGPAAARQRRSCRAAPGAAAQPRRRAGCALQARGSAARTQPGPPAGCAGASATAGSRRPAPP